MTGRDHPVLQAEGVAKSYGGRKILENVSISLGPEELVCLVGVSGAGKTTLFNILSGLERPDGGRVLLNGRDVTGAPGQVSYMLQRDLLLPHKKVLDNAALPLVIRGMKKREARAEAASYFPRFGLEGTEDKYPAQLSGGMRQRAALLRTFLGSREAALLDEPFSALDALTKREIHQWYLGMMDQLRMAALFITHDIDEAILLSDRVCVLSGRPGRVAAELTIRPPRPRDPSFPVSGEFLDYKKRILSLLEA
ncbi:MAG: ABC transporter ATP-binding protein [Oscillibacter sp.]|nr:ABC transporter ATP-binding protein [uncultured Oscillibacter sp.]MCI9300571.1 ABC transporter ATP-binding protein [Oscillibacter sp.]MCI9460627.1 ABC transporter ATP-binding protein [Oscillibacter sp.]